MSTPFLKRGFSTRQAADYIGRSISWLRKRRLRGRDDPGEPGPAFIRDGMTVTYLREDLDKFLDELAVRGRITAPVPDERSPRVQTSSDAAR